MKIETMILTQSCQAKNKKRISINNKKDLAIGYPFPYPLGMEVIQYKTGHEAEAAAVSDAQMRGSIPFDGWNCNDYLNDDEIPCTGWDGISRRCDCDNRRVYWYVTQDKAGFFTAEAVAY
jgi:hypothetical protein